MSNLLDKASIILTPTAYNDGEALCVKPSDGSGDFDFSRNSAATRVNAQGLVENVQILSSNLVQNGDFSEEGVEEVSNGSFSQEGSELVTNGDFATDTDWTLGTGVTISGGKANWTNTINNVGVTQSGIMTSGKNYKVVFTVSNYSSGSVRLRFPSITERVTSNGTYTYYINATDTNLYIQGETNGDANVNFSIDNVSCVEVGQDWTLGTGVSIGENKAVFTSTPSGQSVSQNAVASQIPNGTSVKVSFEVLSISSGSFGVYFSGSLVGSLNSVGVATFYFEKGTETSFYIRALGTTNGSITNISVKEVGQNWDLLNGTITDKYNASLTSYQSGIRVNPFTYTGTVKVTFDLVVTSGSCKFVAGGSNEQIYSTSGTKEIIVTNPSRFEFNAFNLGWVGTLDNVSAVQITTDTSLPRINYEGFSYQDALGSEEIVNGGFDSDTAWIKGGTWTISGGQANFNGGGGAIIWQNVLTSGKSYKFTFEITEQTTGSLRARCGGTLGTAHSAVGVYSEILICGGGIDAGLQTSSGAVLSCDNVSVKEYLGQEVVPDSGCGSWLFEPQSTNLITYSEDFSQSYWNKSNVAIDFGYLSPEGYDNAYRVEHLAQYSVLRRLSTLPAGNTTLSVWLKRIDGNSNYNFYGGGSSKSITITDEWKRYDFSFVADGTNNTFFGIQDPNPSGFGSYYIYGAQVEQQSYATSYIPTSGSTITRNQDVCTNGGSLASINSTEGVLYAEIAALADDLTNKFISISNGSKTERVEIGYSNVSNKIFAFSSVGNVNQCNIGFVLPNMLDYNKIAISYAENNFALWVNGVKVGVDLIASVSAPNTLSELAFDEGDGTDIFYSKTKCVAVWKEALSDAELTELTTI